MRQLCACALCGLLAGHTAAAQILKKLNPFDSVPTVRVSLVHPPLLGDQIRQIEQVAFAQAEGECAPDLVDSLISDFVSSGVEVVDRQNLEAILDESEFSLSGLVNPKDAVQLGKILGPTALIFVTVRRCTTDQQRLTNHRTSRVSGKPIYQFISRTTAYLRGSVQVVDLSTARIHSARTFDETVKRENTSSTGEVAYPDRFQVKDSAIASAVREIHRLFFPWGEVKSLPFYDDKDCNLKLAYNLVLGGDLTGAIRQSEANIQACEIYRLKKPKLVARAYYNLGMSCCLADDFERGMEYLDQSLQLRPHDVTSTSLAECRRGQQAAREMKEFLEGQHATTQSTGVTPAREGEQSEEPVEDRLKKLAGIYESELITRDLYSKRIAAIISQAGAPGETDEERLRNLKQLFEDGLIPQELYERTVSEILGDI